LENILVLGYAPKLLL